MKERDSLIDDILKRWGSFHIRGTLVNTKIINWLKTKDSEIILHIRFGGGLEEEKERIYGGYRLPKWLKKTYSISFESYNEKDIYKYPIFESNNYTVIIKAVEDKMEDISQIRIHIIHNPPIYWEFMNWNENPFINEK